MQVYAKIRGPAGKAVVLDNLPVSSAEEARPKQLLAPFIWDHCALQRGQLRRPDP